jgi:predicted transcriptional regulator
VDEHLNSEHPDSALTREQRRDRRYQKHREYKKKRYAAQQPRVPDAELERLRVPENRQESLRYGTGKQAVCLNCGRVGKNLGHHLPGCPVTPEPLDAYNERWGFPPASLSQKAWRHQYYVQNSAEWKARSRKRYQDNRESLLAKSNESARKKRLAQREQLRLTTEDLAACLKHPPLARTIRGPKWTACLECGALCKSLGGHLRQCHGLTARQYKAKPGPDGVAPRYSRNASLSSMDVQARLSKSRKRPHPERRKISDNEIREIWARGLLTAQGAKLAGLSPTGYWKCLRRLGLDTGAFQRQQQELVVIVSELRKWIELQSQIPTTEQIAQHLSNALLRLPHKLSPREVAEIAAEAAENVLAPDALTMANHIFQRLRGGDGSVSAMRLFERVRAGLKDSKPAFVGTRRKRGPDKTPAEQTVWFSEGRKVEELIPSIGQANARHHVAKTSHRQYSTIEQYHKLYRRWLQHKNPE